MEQDSYLVCFFWKRNYFSFFLIGVFPRPPKQFIVFFLNYEGELLRGSFICFIVYSMDIEC